MYFACDYLTPMNNDVFLYSRTLSCLITLMRLDSDSLGRVTRILSRLSSNLYCLFPFLLQRHASWIMLQIEQVGSFYRQNRSDHVTDRTGGSCYRQNRLDHVTDRTGWIMLQIEQVGSCYRQNRLDHVTERTGWIMLKIEHV